MRAVPNRFRVTVDKELRAGCINARFPQLLLAGCKRHGAGNHGCSHRVQHDKRVLLSCVGRHYAAAAAAAAARAVVATGSRFACLQHTKSGWIVVLQVLCDEREASVVCWQARTRAAAAAHTQQYTVIVTDQREALPDRP